MADFPVLLQTVLDAIDTRAAAEFHRRFFGLVYRPGDEEPAGGDPEPPGWLALRTPDGRPCLAFQRVATLSPTTWPDQAVPQQLHLDTTVATTEELDRHHERALALGARLLFDRRTDPEEPLYVYADPAGHPFCVFVGSA